MRRSSIAICACAAMMVASAGSAGAATLSPTSHNFGSHAVGTVSPPRAFTLTPALLDLLPLTITTTGDFRQTNNCGAALQFISGPCTINVTFAPTSAGTRSGTLSTTTVVLGGPTAALSGTGTAAGGGDNKAGQNQAKACKKKKGKKKGGKKRGKKGADAVAAKKKKGKKKGKKCKKKKKGGKKKGRK